jgi:hypothetical protein
MQPKCMRTVSGFTAENFTATFRRTLPGPPCPGAVRRLFEGLRRPAGFHS